MTKKPVNEGLVVCPPIRSFAAAGMVNADFRLKKSSYLHGLTLSAPYELEGNPGNSLSVELCCFYVTLWGALGGATSFFSHNTISCRKRFSDKIPDFSRRDLSIVWAEIKMLKMIG